MPSSIGALRERLTLQTSAPEALVVTSLTRSGTTATVTTAKAHGLTTGQYATVAGAVPTAYNGKVKVTVTGTTTFSYGVSGSPTTPATGPITAAYANDAQGGRTQTWRDVATVWAEMIPLRGSERLQAAAIQSDLAYRFRIRTRTDLVTTMRALWTPRWPANASVVTLVINAIVPEDDGRVYQVLDCALAPY